MVRNDTVRGINTVRVLRAELAAVGPYSRELLNTLEDWREHVGVVI